MAIGTLILIGAAAGAVGAVSIVFSTSGASRKYELPTRTCLNCAYIEDRYARETKCTESYKGEKVHQIERKKMENDLYKIKYEADEEKRQDLLYEFYEREHTQLPCHYHRY